jgi:hypothetical protein
MTTNRHKLPAGVPPTGKLPAGVPPTGKKVFQALGYLLIAVCCFSCSAETPFSGTDEEREYDVLQLKGKWEQIVEKNAQEPTQSLACHKVVRLAQYRLGQAGKEAVIECVADPHEVLSSELAAMMMSDVYIQLGMVTMAQRAAFEAMVKHDDVADCERPLRRLTETALITGQYELALKYISIIEKNFSSDSWVQSMRALTQHPEQIQQYPFIQQLRENYEKTQDQFFM